MDVGNDQTTKVALALLSLFSYDGNTMFHTIFPIFYQPQEEKHNPEIEHVRHLEHLVYQYLHKNKTSRNKTSIPHQKHLTIIVQFVDYVTFHSNHTFPACSFGVCIRSVTSTFSDP